MPVIAATAKAVGARTLTSSTNHSAVHRVSSVVLSTTFKLTEPGVLATWLQLPHPGSRIANTLPSVQRKNHPHGPGAAVSNHVFKMGLAPMNPRSKPGPAVGFTSADNA